MSVFAWGGSQHRNDARHDPGIGFSVTFHCNFSAETAALLKKSVWASQPGRVTEARAVHSPLARTTVRLPDRLAEVDVGRRDVAGATVMTWKYGNEEIS